MVQLRKLNDATFRVVRVVGAAWPRQDETLDGTVIVDLTDQGYLVEFTDPRNQGGIRPLDKGA